MIYIDKKEEMIVKEKYNIYYSLEYDRIKSKWIVFKNVESEHTMGFGGIFNGNKKECLEYMKENKIKIKK